MKRRRVTQPCAKFTHEPCVHTALFTSNYILALEAVGRHRRLPAALFLLYKCWKSSFIFFELAAFYCLHWRSAPTRFLLNWSKAHLRAEHRDKMYGFKSLRGLKGFRGPAWPKTASRQKHDHRCRPRANEKNCLNEKKTTAIDTHYTHTLFWSVCVLVSDSNCHH